MTGGGERILFAGSVLSESDCAENPVCSAAGNRFQVNFIEALSDATGRPVDVLSYEPARMFSHGRKIVFRGGARFVSGSRRATFFGFLNLPVIKQVTQFLTLLLALVRWHRRNRDVQRVVIVYNVFAPHALAVHAARLLRGGKAVALIADLPHGLYDFTGIWGWFQRLDFRIQTRIIRRFDGLIVLTEVIGSDFAPAVPAIVMEGAVTAASGLAPGSTAPDRHVLLFTGGLTEVNGVPLLLEAFDRLRGSQYRLRISGRGPLEDLVLAAASRDPRIEFLGFLPYEKVIEEQASATLLLNIRATDHPINRYTFPSKLLEYMLSGRPVLTTRLVSIPRDYEPHLFVVDDGTPEGWAERIEQVCGESTDTLSKVGREACAFVLQEKTWARQGQRVAGFVRNLLAIS